MSEELTVPQGAPESLEHATTGIPKKRDLVLNRPGNINYAGERGSFPGCRLIEFTNYGEVKGLEDNDAAKFLQQRAESGSPARASSSELANLYFKHRGNMLTVNMSIDASGSVWVLATNQLEGDELEAFHEVANRTTQWMEEWREKKQAEKEKQEEALRQNEIERNELIELGRKEKAGNFVKRARDAEDKVEQLSKDLLRLRRKVEKLEGK